MVSSVNYDFPLNNLIENLTIFLSKVTQAISFVQC